MRLDLNRTNTLARRRRCLIGVIKYAVLTAVALIWVYPFVWMVSASLKTNNEIFADKLSLIPQAVQWDNYVRAWKNANFSQYFVNTIHITFFTVVIVLIVTMMMGYALGRFRFPGKRAVMGVIAASMFIPMGFNLIPVFRLIKNMGLMNSRWGVILAQVGSLNVVFVMMFASSFAQIPRELHEAALIDGCGFLRIFLQIMVPLSKPIIGSVVIMQTIWSWSEFLLPLVLTLNSASLRTLAVGLYSLKGEIMLDWTGLAAGAAIALLPIIVVFVFLQKYFVDGISGAVKG
ncbi:carbohydrate ABC transporter membrane protein 2 (CUT1 family) [Harryflintia acetispora]|uniref:Carbohydrate ABC transporter membrane protein 2 (CUT1 family) n=1 Tax=Harryflintia acetispora TaxID=1849041 RepID=A0A9X8UJA1_9FIRM|nr:carbohydrate ABC transporter membrane protein 2 (CUT1 family) [Harryflintia acetispora]